MKINKLAQAAPFSLGPNVTRRFLSDDTGYTCVHMSATAGEGTPPHSHPHQQTMFVLNGNGVFQIGNEKQTVEAGDCVMVPGNAEHCFAAFSTDMEWVEFFSPRREDIHP